MWRGLLITRDVDGIHTRPICTGRADEVAKNFAAPGADCTEDDVGGRHGRSESEQSSVFSEMESKTR